jgi:hypothetical protein
MKSRGKPTPTQNHTLTRWWENFLLAASETFFVGLPLVGTPRHGDERRPYNDHSLPSRSFVHSLTLAATRPPANCTALSMACHAGPLSMRIGRTIAELPDAIMRGLNHFILPLDEIARLHVHISFA